MSARTLSLSEAGRELDRRGIRYTLASTGEPLVQTDHLDAAGKPSMPKRLPDAASATLPDSALTGDRREG